MKCQSCSSLATVHLTNIVEGHKKQLHLCQSCAEQQQLIQKHELNLPAILQTLIGQHIGPMTDELARLTCPACGIKYMEFRKEGRLGCPHDYQVFRAGLDPLLFRIHRSKRHVGKKAAHSPERVVFQMELAGLTGRLQEAVDTENYEEAARLRDLIRHRKAPE